jgi:hypothetical protein
MPDEQTIIEHIRGRYERDRRIPHPGEIAVAECAAPRASCWSGGCGTSRRMIR